MPRVHSSLTRGEAAKSILVFQGLRLISVINFENEEEKFSFRGYLDEISLLRRERERERERSRSKVKVKCISA